jgi:hypothetical protein
LPSSPPLPLSLPLPLALLLLSLSPGFFKPRLVSRPALHTLDGTTHNPSVEAANKHATPTIVRIITEIQRLKAAQKVGRA